MKLFFLTVSLVTSFASEPGDTGSLTEAQPFPNGPGPAGNYSYVDEALQMMDGRTVVADEQNNPIYPKTGDMSMLLGRSRWCRSRDGECRRGKFSCPHKYESPYGRPYCTSKKRRCCHPATGPTSLTPTPISTTTSIPTTTVASTTRAHSTTTFPVGSGWCSSRDGECRRGNYPCPYKYESPFGRPYCTSRLRRCCYPGKGPTSTTQTPITGPTSTTATQISTTTSIHTETVDSTTRAHSTTTFPGSGWCSSRDGECRRGNYLCPYKYESPFGSPYCTSRIRRCCYPGKGPTSTTPTPTQCPEGLFRAGYSEQCFLFLMDIQRNWTDAKKKCENEGYSLAEPQEPLAVRSYIVNTYDPYWSTWLGAQGDGSSLRWLRSGEAISNSDPLWRKGDPGIKITPVHKLVLGTSAFHLSKYNNTPFKSYPGGYTRNTLCELVLN